MAEIPRGPHKFPGNACAIAVVKKKCRNPTSVADWHVEWLKRSQCASERFVAATPRNYILASL